MWLFWQDRHRCQYHLVLVMMNIRGDISVVCKTMEMREDLRAVSPIYDNFQIITYGLLSC